MMSLLFFVVAVIYSMVGMGGGSSYIAILALFDVPYLAIPFIARLCNLIVVTGNTYHFVRQGHFSWKLSWPFIVSAIPMTFFGATIPISKQLFLTLLGGTLFLLGVKLLIIDRWYVDEKIINPINRKWAFGIGAVLGFLSGLTGVGGGIFLAPVLHLLRWGTPKQIAASASVFIFSGSLAGLAGQAITHWSPSNLTDYWILFVVVLCGGQLGSFLGSSKFSQNAIRKCTGAVVLFAGMRLLMKVLSS
ncbi:MAG: hypothetical protein K940chlam7_00843 [Chlamydiae bacterium]|nr:hypothetical protein [Chlamydiota bacterium]